MDLGFVKGGVTMAAKKTVRKTAVTPVRKKTGAKAGKGDVPKVAVSGKAGAAGVKRGVESASVPPVCRPGVPSARVCPLVLDGEVAAADFSPKDCLACDEFDCRFCATVHGSGNLRSRLFASDDGDDTSEEDDGWGDDDDTDTVNGEDADADDLGDGEDVF
ncbi:MAG: hypothetical protein PHV28_02765 [Kiritimatiellae bacterium]|nr:hypothetical protein [Kiritimatiellia bacterium]